MINRGNNEWVKVEKMSECSGDISWYGKWANSIKAKKGRTLITKKDVEVEMLSCQDWYVVYHKNE